jgi:hypothetical protein
LKHELWGPCFQTAEELPAKLRKLVGEISPETLLDVSHHWIARCERVIPIDGNCFNKLSSGDICFTFFHSAETILHWGGHPAHTVWRKFPVHPSDFELHYIRGNRFVLVQ